MANEIEQQGTWQCSRCGRLLSIDSPDGSTCQATGQQCTPVWLLTQPTGARRANLGKPRMHLLPPEPLLDLVEVLTRGAQKYQPRNWEKGLTFSSTWDSMQRHLWAWWQRQDIDQESGQHHLAHALCNLVFLLTFVRRIERGKLPADLDDRP
jgi:Domain of unknown function (DUF5664)